MAHALSTRRSAGSPLALSFGRLQPQASRCEKDSVPPKDRFLALAARLTDRRFEQMRLKAITWCNENPSRLSESNLVALAALRVSDSPTDL